METRVTAVDLLKSGAWYALFEISIDHEGNEFEKEIGIAQWDAEVGSFYDDDGAEYSKGCFDIAYLQGGAA
jgi:hypothetical protein